MRDMREPRGGQKWGQGMQRGFYFPWGEDLGEHSDFDLNQSFPPQLHNLHPRQLEVLTGILSSLSLGIWPTNGDDDDKPEDCRLVICVFGPGDAFAGNIDLAEAIKVGLEDWMQCGPKAELIALRKVRAVIDDAIAAREAASKRMIEG